MNTKITFGKLTILVISLILFSSCAKVRKSRTTEKIAQHGIDLAQYTQTFLENNRILQNQQKFKMEYLNIVNDSFPDKYEIEYDIDCDEDLQNLYRIKALNSLKSAFIAYQMQLDIKISQQASGVRNKIFASCAILDSLSVSEDIKNKSIKLRSEIYNKKYKLRQAIFVLTNIYSDFWQEINFEILKQILLQKKSSSEGIKQISVKAFDKDKLKNIVNEPFEKNSILANLYKLQMLEENNKKFVNAEEQINKISSAFELLTKLEAEVLKRKQMPIKQKELNNQLDLLLDKHGSKLAEKIGKTQNN